MTKRRARARERKPVANHRRDGISFLEALSSANRRAQDQANRRSGRRELKSVRAAIAATAPDCDDDQADWLRRLARWLVAALLLPVCWVTTWTLLSRFSHATVEQGFWQTPEFWYFAIGMMLMTGWFFSGLAQSFFLYLYVLGHELTHALFVILFRGRITEFHVSHAGGYITTDKTNLLIALSPYFVPFWSLVAAAGYLAAGCFTDLRGGWDLAFYAVTGVTWTFHMLWTLWMLPRDQPDLKENGTFLSLVIIYLANLLVLVALLCAAEEAPLGYCGDFAREWLRHAATWGDQLWRWTIHVIGDWKAAGRL